MLQWYKDSLPYPRPPDDRPPRPALGIQGREGIQPRRCGQERPGVRPRPTAPSGCRVGRVWGVACEPYPLPSQPWICGQHPTKSPLGLPGEDLWLPLPPGQRAQEGPALQRALGRVLQRHPQSPGGEGAGLSHRGAWARGSLELSHCCVGHCPCCPQPLDHGSLLMGPWQRMPTPQQTQGRPPTAGFQEGPGCPPQARWSQRTPVQPH